MRVLSSKIHCPSFICVCKPSSHLYKPGPFKLENTPVEVVSVSVPIASDHLSTAEENPIATIEVKEGALDDECPKATIGFKEGDLDGNQQIDIILKSSLKKGTPLGIDTPKEVAKKKVQWMDHLGDELLEIKEFEASEEDDSDNEGENRSCVCVIL